MGENPFLKEGGILNGETWGPGEKENEEKGFSKIAHGFMRAKKLGGF